MQSAAPSFEVKQSGTSIDNSLSQSGARNNSKATNGKQAADFDSLVTKILTENKDQIEKNQQESGGQFSNLMRSFVHSSEQEVKGQTRGQRSNSPLIKSESQTPSEQQKSDFDNFVKKILTENKETIGRNKREQGSRSNSPFPASGSPKPNQTILDLLNQKPKGQGSRPCSPLATSGRPCSPLATGGSTKSNLTIMDLLTKKPEASPLTQSPMMGAANSSAMGPASSALLGLLASNNQPSPKPTPSPSQPTHGPASSALLSLLSKTEPLSKSKIEDPVSKVSPTLEAALTKARMSPLEVILTSGQQGTPEFRPARQGTPPLQPKLPTIPQQPETGSVNSTAGSPGIASLEVALEAARQGGLRGGSSGALKPVESSPEVAGRQ